MKLELLFRAQLEDLHLASGNRKPTLSMNMASQILGKREETLLSDKNFPAERKGKGWEVNKVRLTAARLNCR